jgi:hypothetical protein
MKTLLTDAETVMAENERAALTSRAEAKIFSFMLM